MEKSAGEALPRGFTLALHWAAGTSPFSGAAGATTGTSVIGVGFFPTIGVAPGLELGRVNLKTMLFFRYGRSSVMVLTAPPPPGTTSDLTVGVTPLVEVTVLPLDHARGFLMAGPHFALSLREPGTDEESVGWSFGALFGLGLRAMLHPRLGLGVTAGVLWSMATFRGATTSSNGGGFGAFGMLDLTAFFGRLAHPRP